MFSFSELTRLRVLCLLAGLFICHAALAEIQTPQAVADLQNAAADCMKADDVAGAIAKYQDIIQAYPATTYALDAQRCIVTAHVHNDALPPAESELAKMLSTYSGLPEALDNALNHVIIAYNNNGHYQQAIDCCRYMLSHWPDCDRAMWGVSRQAQAQIMLGNLAEADQLVDSLKSEFSEQPYYKAVLCNDIAGSFIAKGHNDRAAIVWQAVNEEFPADVTSKNKLASYYLQQGDLTTAADYIGQLKQNCAEKDACESFYWLASTHKTAHPKFCAELYRQMVAAWPQAKQSVEAQKRVVTLQIRLGDMAAADTELQRFLTLYGETDNAASLLREIKGCYWNAGQRAKAQQLCVEMLERYPDDSTALLNQADWICGALAKGDIATAETEIDTFLANYTEPADVFLAQAARIQGECLYRNDYSLAIDVGSRVLEQYPTHEKAVWIHQKLARAYLGLDVTEQAEAEVNIIVEGFASHPEYAGVMNGIAEAYRSNQQFDRAIELYELAIKKATDEKERLCAYTGIAKCQMAASVATAEADARPESMTVEAIIRDCPGEAQAAAVIDVADGYREQGRYAESVGLYRFALGRTEAAEEALRAYAGMAKSQIWSETSLTDSKVTDCFVPTADPNFAASSAPICPDVNAIVDTLVADYNDVSTTGFHVFQIGEEYFRLGQQARVAGQKEKAAGYYEQAIHIWQENIDSIEDTQHFAEACYYTAFSYEFMGQYGEALGWFEQLLSESPGFDRAWNAQFMVARCADEMRKRGELTMNEARPLVLEGCRKLKENYPGCKAADIADRLAATYKTN